MPETDSRIANYHGVLGEWAFLRLIDSPKKEPSVRMGEPDAIYYGQVIDVKATDCCPSGRLMVNKNKITNSTELPCDYFALMIINTNNSTVTYFGAMQYSKLITPEKFSSTFNAYVAQQSELDEIPRRTAAGK